MKDFHAFINEAAAPKPKRTIGTIGYWHTVGEKTDMGAKPYDKIGYTEKVESPLRKHSWYLAPKNKTGTPAWFLISDDGIMSTMIIWDTSGGTEGWWYSSPFTSVKTPDFAEVKAKAEVEHKQRERIGKAMEKTYRKGHG